jgi:hypothetical protein
MSEWNDPVAAELTPTEREMLGLDQTVTYRYRCSQCRHEDDVPDVVIMGFAASGGCKPGQMPRLVCPNCGGPFRALGRGRPRAAR